MPARRSPGSASPTRITFELTDYANVTGQFDKIASIGMYEHIGLKNIPAYMQKDAHPAQ